MKNTLLIVVGLICFLPAGAAAKCMVNKDGSGQYTHFCDDYRQNSFQVPASVGESLLDTDSESDTRQYQFGADDSYMSDFGNDSVSEDMDFGADDDPGLGSEY